MPLTPPAKDYHFVELSHPNHLLAGLNALGLSCLFCDVTLCVEGHMVNSKIRRTMLENNKTK
jgi:hypothetical protein